MKGSKERAIVLVHGAWHGGWCYGRVADLLRADGYRVYVPTLTGLGERSHLLTRSINLSTHIADIANIGKQNLPRRHGDTEYSRGPKIGKPEGSRKKIASTAKIG